MQVNVCQQRRTYPALWDSKIAVLKEPVFHQSRFQKTGDEFQETPISNAFCQAIEENFVMHVVKRSHNSIPYSTTQKKRTGQRLKSTILPIHCLGGASH